MMEVANDWFHREMIRQARKYEGYRQPTLAEVIAVMEKWELITGRPVYLEVSRGRIRPKFARAEPVVIVDKDSAVPQNI
jgi:hypothetical protein